MKHTSVILLIVFLSGGVALADAPTVDETFTSYLAKRGSTRFVKKKPVTFFTIEGTLGVHGVVPDRSILKMTIKQGRKTKGTVLCKTLRSDYALKPVNGAPPPDLWVTRCHDRKIELDKAATYTVEWHYIDGDTDDESLVASHSVLIRNAPNIDYGSKKPWYPTPYVDRHGEVLSTILFLRTLPYSSRGKGYNQAFISLHASPEYSENVTSSSFLRCKVDGKSIKLREKKGNERSSWMSKDTPKVHKLSDASLANWNRKNKKKNPPFLKDSFLFRHFLLELPLGFSTDTIVQGQNMADHRKRTSTEVHPEHTLMTPGKWECAWKNDKRQTLRIFHWTIGADGLPVAHEEQAAGLSLAPYATLIDVTIPKDSPLDFRTNPKTITKTAFHGRGFKGKVMKAAARKVPKKGVPVPK